MHIIHINVCTPTFGTAEGAVPCYPYHTTIFMINISIYRQCCTMASWFEHKCQYHCASGSDRNVQGFPATCPSRSARRCAVMRQGAGSSRTLHTVPLSSCTDVQLRARHRRCRLVAAWRKAPMWLRRPSALRGRLPCQSVL